MPGQADTELAALLRAHLPAIDSDPQRGVTLVVAQLRSICEIYCANWCGAPSLPPARGFALLGAFAALDQLEAMGMDAIPEQQRDILTKVAGKRILLTAASFGLRAFAPPDKVGEGLLSAGK